MTPTPEGYIRGGKVRLASVVIKRLDAHSFNTVGSNER